METSEFEPILWKDSDNRLIVRVDFALIIDHADWVDLDRAIPASWNPILFARRRDVAAREET